jgi:SET domain
MNLFGSACIGLFVAVGSDRQHPFPPSVLSRSSSLRSSASSTASSSSVTNTNTAADDTAVDGTATKKRNTDATTNSNKYANMLDWLKADEATFISDAIALKESTRGGGYGAFLTAPVQQGEVLFQIPRTKCITLQNVVGDDKCGKLFTALMEKAGPGGNTVAMAGYIAKERLQMERSAYAPYLATLPWARGVNKQEHILYWTDEQIEELLPGSMCYREAVDLRNEVALAIRVLDTIIGTAALDEQEQGFRLPWQTKLQRKPVPGLPDVVKAALVCLLTRAFQDKNDDDDNDNEKLVPLLDMLQHSDKPNISHWMRKDDRSVEVRARVDMGAGVELLNQYRSEMEEQMPYSRFFVRFGFVPGIREPLENLLRDKSSIFFAQKAEV